MSDAYNVKQLRSLKNQLEEELKKLYESIEAVKAENKSLDSKIIEMNKRGSKLAKELVSSLIRQKENNSKKICEYVEGRIHLEERLKAVTQRIECPDPTEYVKAQVKEMLNDFCEHVKKNEWKYGLAITTVFCIRDEQKDETIRNGISVKVPTGNIEIYIPGAEKNEQSIGVSSKNFPFNHMMLYTEHKANAFIRYTDWFKHYLRVFDDEFYKVFGEQFEHESFKLTVSENNNSFTLELV